jgi:Fe-S cluster assembly protein SufD
MNETTASERYQALVTSALPGLASSTSWLDTQRLMGLQALRKQPLPQRRDEAWRYSGVERLLKREFVLAGQSEVTVLPSVTAHAIAADAYRIVFVDGHFQAKLSKLPRDVEGIYVGSLREALSANHPRVRQSLQLAARRDKSLFTALNTALLADGLWLHVAANTVVDRPIELLCLSNTHEQPVTTQPRHLVLLEPGAQATLIERHSAADGSGHAGFANHVSEILLGENARLEHLRLLDQEPAAFHLDSQFVRQHGGSSYQQRSFILSGGWMRSEVEIDFAAPGAEAVLDGLFVVGDGQTSDMQLDIRHNAPHCQSQTRVKGIAHGRGRGVFDGRILVAQDAQKTEAHLSSDNLLLSDSAEIDTKPQLEIYADDVKCSHGTTVGQLDETQLFYLRSRGIPADRAHSMLCQGFAAEVVDSCTNSDFREVLAGLLDARLQGLADGG